MLYSPELYEPLTDEPWDEERARAGVRAIVADTVAAFDPERLWPSPDEWDSEGAELPLTHLYAGASGVVWALDRLRQHVEVELDLAAVADRALELWRAAPDFAERHEPPVRTHAGLYFGETGPLAVACLLGAGPADDLHARVRENEHGAGTGLLHGPAGTMLAAQAMLERTGEERWAEAWRASADVLWDRRDGEGLWENPPFGRGLGAAHGASTTAWVLLQGGELLAAERRDALARETAAALARHALREDGLANWPMVAEEGLVAFDGKIRAQWCHGAAGVVASAAPYLDEELLVAGAELCWRAGAPNEDKGPGLCHGTAGTGYAFLKVFERTGDELWLERARRFAVHALGQIGRRGRSRYSLWTGDLGAALFVRACVEGRATFPVVDGL